MAKNNAVRSNVVEGFSFGQTASVPTQQEEKLTAEQKLMAEVIALRAEIEQRKAAAQRRITLKVSEKGGVSVYGLGRFPVTLYGEQWEKLLSVTEEIRSFLKANASKLSRKE